MVFYVVFPANTKFSFKKAFVLFMSCHIHLMLVKFFSQLI